MFSKLLSKEYLVFYLMIGLSTYSLFLPNVIANLFSISSLLFISFILLSCSLFFVSFFYQLYKKDNLENQVIFDNYMATQNKKNKKINKFGYYINSFITCFPFLGSFVISLYLNYNFFAIVLFLFFICDVVAFIKVNKFKS